MRILKVATCNLTQWAMEFDNNLKNIKESIRQAKEAGAAIRLGPELEVSGYGCEDHFLELDTVTHSWECLKELLVGDWTDGILCSIGMAVINGSERYNCQVLCMDRKIIMIRPKLRLANDGNYREFRWFKAWKQKYQLVDFQLPADVAEAISQKTAPFGYGYVQFLDAAVAAEVCEELFSPVPPHTELALNGVEVFLNASGSHHQLRKLNLRVRALESATQSLGGVYVYSNHQGCDGGRLYYDGCSCVVLNGDVISLASQFSLKDVEVVTAQVDLDKVTSLRGSVISFQQQSKGVPTVKSVQVPVNLCQSIDRKVSLSSPIKINYHCPEEEIALGPACWLWDYLRRSGASGFLLPLSGGADSSSVSAIVGSMCQLVVKEIASGNEQVKADAVRMGCYSDGQYPTDPKEFVGRIFYTLFLGTENSSQDTRNLSKKLAAEVGSKHYNLTIDSMISPLVTFFQALTGKLPRFAVDGGSEVENLALQNIQARIRMVIAFFLASLLPWVNNKPRYHLVLSTSNVDESLRGHLTKYDCSSADLNPLGSMNKTDIWAFMRWGAVNLGYPTLAQVADSPPSAELEPIRPDYRQTDELDMGMTYEELSVYGKLRKTFRCGPFSMFKVVSHPGKRCSSNGFKIFLSFNLCYILIQNLCVEWSAKCSPSEVAEKVKLFFYYYSVNRHKMTTLTPSYYVESYSAEDNRYDLRQFLYNISWPYQFRKIDELVQKLEENKS